MAKRINKAQLENIKRPYLIVHRAKAAEQIQCQIEKGRALLNIKINNEQDLENARSQYRKWSDYNAELLRRIVDTDDLVNDYYPGVISGFWGPTSLHERVQGFYSDVNGYTNRLESIVGRLELIPELEDLVMPQDASVKAVAVTRRVFVVHGHDEEAKQSVARCLERLALVPIILHEQPNQGRTIIEKFEDYTDVGFAVILLTPDDIGASKGDADNLHPRARQNVILELGFFIGRLGRGKVCALYKGDLELPSDFSGVLWERMDTGGAWQFNLAREIKSVGIDIDVNRLL